ncbi:MAG TPA: DUF1566 domain-containing protein [Polyangiales bacterium]|nr:DUF1566 domain-containing protein [Polyangiales bacterium]
MVTLERKLAAAQHYEVAETTVKDVHTGLTWQRNVEPTLRSVAEAKAYCETLTLAGGGWRLPALKELLTLVDLTRADPAIDVQAFSGSMSLGAWTSSIYLGAATNHAWFVHFLRSVSGHEDVDIGYQARCVR